MPVLIPVASEAAEDFIVRARDTLQLAGTHVYVDTSLAMWLTAIGPSSRAAFIQWSSTLDDRVHVPAWTVHEYYRHHQRRTQVNGISEKCTAAEKALAELSAHMRIYADGPLVPGEPEMAFSKHLARAQEHVADATNIARKWDYQSAADEVIGWMNGRALASTMAFQSFDKLQQRGSVRYGHEVPPGFEDGHKSVNRYGDLMFWEDVVADAGERGAAVAVVLTRDRKKDWFLARMEADVSDVLRQLRGTWPAVPVPHPMLSLEMKASAKADLLLVDEHYLGAIMWSTDKDQFGRLAALTFGKSLEWLATATAPPPGIAARAAKRAASDTVSMLTASSLIRATKAIAAPPVLEMLATLEGEAPEIEEALGTFTPERLQAMVAEELASLARRTYDLALVGPSPAAALAGRLLDAVDKVDALHASAIVGGMLVGAYFDGAAVRDRPVGNLLQEVFEWCADQGVARTLTLLGKDLLRSRSPALYLPSSTARPLEVRIDASESNTTTPVTVGQLYIGPQAVLVDPAVDPETALSALLLGAQETTVEALVEAVGRHYGIPLDLLQLADTAPDETRTILISTGVDRFDPYRLPLRQVDQATVTTLPAAADPLQDIQAEDGDEPATLVGEAPPAEVVVEVAEPATGDATAHVPQAEAATELEAEDNDDDDEDNHDPTEEDEEDMQ